MKIEMDRSSVQSFLSETKVHGRHKMTFQWSVFLFRWALNLAFALVAFRGKTCDGLDFLALFRYVQVGQLTRRYYGRERDGSKVWHNHTVAHRR